jgi:long-subunit fatty acid transport protein
MGFGGAFAALADDATAAFANPAGLIQIIRPEISIEGRGSSYSTPYVAGGRIFGEPTGMGIDDTSGLRRGESSDDLAGLSFLSFVYPGKRWSLAAYRHQLANFETASALQGLYSGPWPQTPVRREFDQSKTADLEIVGYGLTGAYSVNDRFSIGAGLTYFDGDFRSTSEVWRGTGASAFFSPAPTNPENLVYSTSVEIDDTTWGLVAGFLWRISPRWRTGGFFRHGPELESTTSLTTGPHNQFGLPAGTTQILQVQPMVFPDVYGLGFSYRSVGERLTLAFEWDRIGYSSLLGYFNSTGFENQLADGTELHFGAEYLFSDTRPMIAVRAGAWTDPAHRIHDDSHYVTRAVLPPGEDQLHLSFGLGVAFWEVQLDVAADFSDRVNTASVSTIYSF